MTAFAYQVVFDVPLRALFPELYRDVEKDVLQRACALRDQLLSQQLNRRSIHKLSCIREMIKRIEAPDEV
jgi:hypothetical protein